MRVSSLQAVFLLVCCTANAGQGASGGPVPRPEPPSDAPVKTLRDTMEPEATGEGGKDATEKSPAQILDEFKSAYRAIGRARLAVFLNRELSDDVREWNVVFGITHAGSEVTARREPEGATELSERHSSGDVQVHAGPAPDGSRRSPAESWMWEFEDGFMGPFLETRCTLVDRATILRLTAADALQPGQEYATPAAKRIEIEALRRHADVFIELLVTRSAGSAYGYEFRATAKEVDTGQLLAIATSLGREHRRSIRVTREGYDVVSERSLPAATEVVVTNRGYELGVPSVAEASRELALELMQKLARSWQ